MTIVRAGEAWVGHRMTLLERESGARIAYLSRFGEGLLPDDDTVVQADDVLHLAVPSEAVRGLEDLLQRGSSDA